MKKIIVMAMLAIAAGRTTAQDNKLEVPADVIDAFSMLYPTVKNVAWKHRQADFEASFVQNEKTVSLLFDNIGMLKEVRKEIVTSELPAGINDTLAIKFPAWKIRKATRIDVRGSLNYEVEVQEDDQTINLAFNILGGLINAAPKHGSQGKDSNHF